MCSSIHWVQAEMGLIIYLSPAVRIQGKWDVITAVARPKEATEVMAMLVVAISVALSEHHEASVGET